MRVRGDGWLVLTRCDAVLMCARGDGAAGEAAEQGGVCAGPGLWEGRRPPQVEERPHQTPGLCR